jgi:hypothetical protein
MELLLFLHSSSHLVLVCGDGAGFVASAAAKQGPAIDRANRTKKVIDSNFFIPNPPYFDLHFSVMITLILVVRSDKECGLRYAEIRRHLSLSALDTYNHSKFDCQAFKKTTLRYQC